MKQSLTYDEFIKLNKKNYLFIDIREHIHYSQIHLSHTINIPYSSIYEYIHTIYTNKPIVFICYSGGLSQELCKHMNMNHSLSYYLKGGIRTLIPSNDYY